MTEYDKQLSLLLIQDSLLRRFIVNVSLFIYRAANSKLSLL